MKSTTSERLSEIMSERGLRQVDILNMCAPFCKSYGIKLQKNDLSQYLSGKTKPGQEKLTILGKALGVQEAWLMGYDVPKERPECISADNIIPIRKANFKPIVGTIACGEPIFAEQNIESYIPVPNEIRCDFCLRCKGDSMVEAGIHNGDIVYIRRQDDVDDGSIAAVIICGTDTEATLKRVYHNDDHITLMPANPAYSPILVTGETLSNLRILGVAVAVTSKLPGR